MAKRTKDARKAKARKAPRASRIDTRRWGGLTARQAEEVHQIHTGKRELDARERQMPVGDRDDDDVPPGFETLTEARARDGVAEARLKAEAEDLGPIILPTPPDALRVLGELAALYHERFDAQRRHDQLKRELKQASDAIADLTTRIGDRLRAATHRTGLPLFADEDAALAAREA